PKSASFRMGYLVCFADALSSRLYPLEGFPAAFRLLAFASWDILCPLGIWAFLAVGLVRVWFSNPDTLSGLTGIAIGITAMPDSCLLYTGAGIARLPPPLGGSFLPDKACI